MTTLTKWINENKDQAKQLGQEGFILDVTEQIWEAMEELGISKQELAARLGCSKANISRLLDGERNMTLRSLYDIATSMNFTPHFNLIEEKVASSISLGSYKDAKWENIEVNDSYRCGITYDPKHFALVCNDYMMEETA